MDANTERKKDLERIKLLRYIDDEFMRVCFEGDIPSVQLVLRIVLKKSDLIVEEVKTEQEMKNLSRRSVWLDVLAIDSGGQYYNIEIQRDDAGADPKRARYHSSIIDSNEFERGKDFKDLFESYVIFITEHDVFEAGLPLYTFERICIETGKALNDGAHVVYVNGENRDGDTELGRLMQDFFCTEPNKMNYKELADRARYFKEETKGVERMNSVLEEMRKEVIADERKESALRMIADGLPLDKVAAYSGLSIDSAQKLAEQKTA